MAVDSGFFVIFISTISNGGYEATPLQVARVPLSVGGSIPHQRGRQMLLLLLTQGVLTHFTPPFVLFGLAYHDPVLWVATFTVGFTIWQCQWALMLFPPPYVHVPSEVCSHITLPEVFTHPQWMLQSRSTAEVATSHFPPQGSFTGRFSGECLTIVLLWHPLPFTSYRGSLALGGTGTPVPCMTAAHTQGNANLWCKEKLVLVENSLPSMLVCHFIRGDACHDLMHHLPGLLFPPILDLPLSLKSICLH